MFGISLLNLAPKLTAFCANSLLMEVSYWLSTSHVSPVHMPVTVTFGVVLVLAHMVSHASSTLVK